MIMKTNNRFSYVLITILVLTLTCALVLCACDKKTKNNSSEGKEETSTPQLSVSFDQNSTFNEETLNDALDVEIVKNGVRSKIAYTIKNSTVTEDGQYIDVTIIAEGIEKTIRLPYAAPAQYAIRADLMPLYKLLSADGDKYLSMSITGNLRMNEDSEKYSVKLKAIANLFADKEAQFALLSETDESPKTLAVYNDEVLSVGGFTVTKDTLITFYSELINYFTFDFDIVEGEGDDAIESMKADAEEEKEDNMELDITSIFERLSLAFDATDKLVNLPIVKAMNLSISAENGVYTFSLNTKNLIRLVKLLADEDQLEQLEKSIDLLNLQFGGAIKSGDMVLSGKIDITEGADISLKAENKRDGFVAQITAKLEIADSAYTMPTVADEDAKDLEITVPIKLPQNDFDMAIKAVVHTSAIFGSNENTNYVTATIYKNGEDEDIELLQFVLDERFAYLDANGIANMLNADMVARYYTAFEIDGQPATFKQVLPSIIGRLGNLMNFGGNTEEGDEDADEEYQDDDGSQNVDLRFANGYGVSPVDEDDNLFFEIGTTESDLRARLFVYTFDENDQQVPFSDYQVEGFDGSVSFNGDISIVFDKDYICDVGIVIYNPESKKESSVSVDTDLIAAKGTTIQEMQSYIGAKITYTDGTISWSEYVSDESDGYTITAVMSNAGYDMPDQDYVFSATGDNIMFVVRNTTSTQYVSTVYIYDPENLKPVKLVCSQDSIYVNEDTTEDSIREELQVFVLYDDGMTGYDDPVSDYKIESFAYGEESFNIIWGDLTPITISMIQDSETPNEVFEMGKPTDYLRFVDQDGLNEEDDLLTVISQSMPAIQEILSQQSAKALLKSVVSFEKGETDLSLRVIINTEDDNDLLALVNLFVGIPTEDGWKDIDKETLVEMITSESAMFDIGAMFQKVFGVTLVDFLEPLYFDVNLSWNDGIVLGMQFNDGVETQYLVTGIEFRLVDASLQFKPTEEMIASAQSFENISSIAFLLLGGAMV